MKRIGLFMLKPHAVGTIVEEEVKKMFLSAGLEIYFEKIDNVNEEQLRQSQPILATDKFNEEQQRDILQYSLGKSKFFLITGDEDVFKKLKAIKWKIRDEYSQMSLGKICPAYVHSPENFEEVFTDTKVFIPEKLDFVKSVNRTDSAKQQTMEI